MTPDQLNELAARWQRAQRAGTDMPLQLANDALRYVTHHPGEPLPPNVAELLLAALSRYGQVERAARSLVTGRVPADDGYDMVRDALRANLGNGRSLDDEARS
jgi:hypothetical protein